MDFKRGSTVPLYASGIEKDLFPETFEPDSLQDLHCVQEIFLSWVSMPLDSSHGLLYKKLSKWNMEMLHVAIIFQEIFQYSLETQN